MNNVPTGFIQSGEDKGFPQDSINNSPLLRKKFKFQSMYTKKFFSLEDIYII